jgi:putative ABC transport system permease protein
LAFGDNVSGARLIGTEPSFMELSPGPGAPPSFRIDRGRMWAADHELVLGSRAAAETGLSLGDIVQPGHGVEPGLDADIHDVPHTVVGILAPSGTAFDGAVLTSLQSVIAVHEDHEEEPHAEEPHAEHAITAVLVRPVGFGEANSLWQEAYAGTEVQAAFPGQELGGVFDLLDQAQELLILVGYLASIMAALTLFLAVYAAGATRDRLLAIMRALGARRTTVFRVVMVEALIVALLGAIVGRVIGTVVALAVAGRVTGDSSIPVEIAWLPSLEPWLWLLPVGLGLLAGLVPALRAYRADVLSRLAAN